MEFEWEEKKPAEEATHINKPAEEATHINLKVKAQDGREVFYKVKPKAQLSKLMKSYCQSLSLVVDSAVFLFDGLRVKEFHTPEDFDMEDGDEIHVFLHMFGGGLPGA